MWDWYEIQKSAYGFLNLKPNEFWELYPRDIILMNEGYQMQREYKEALHLDNLRLLRYVGHTVYMGIQTKKGYKKAKLEKYYPLPFDVAKDKELYSDEEIKEFFERKEPIITNGKLRGYLLADGSIQDIN